MNGSQVQFFGRMTRDPELQYSTNGGHPFTTVAVAVNTYFGPDNPEHTDFYNVTLWRRNAENAVNNCRKGSLVFIQGRLTLRDYTRNDGTQGRSLQVSANTFRGPLMYAQAPTETQTTEVENLPDNYDATQDTSDLFDLSEQPA